MGREPSAGSDPPPAARRGIPFGDESLWAGVFTWVTPVLALLAVTLPQLNGGDWRGDTGWYAALGLSGWRNGALWTLSSGDGQPYFNKPPLALWIHGLLLRLTGPELWAARLPTIFAAAGIVIATVGIARRVGGRWAGGLSGVVLALSLEFFRRTREISLDLWQLLFLALAAWVLIAGVSGGRRKVIALSGVGVGLALLCKPLMGMLFFPIAAAGIWAMSGPASLRRTAGPLGAAVVLALGVALPWHLSMWSIHGHAFTAQYFGAEIAARAAGESVGAQRGQPVWFYAQQLLEGYWPWMIPLVIALFDLAVGRVRGRAAAVMRFGLVWAVLWLVVLSVFPDRRDRYSVPIYPGLALVVGPWLAWMLRERLPRGRHLVRAWLFRGSVAVGIVLAVLPIPLQKPPAPQWGNLASFLATVGDEPIYDGAFAGAPAARVYLLTGRWPLPTTDRAGKVLNTPSSGALLAYHRRGGRSPNANESVVFRSGDLTITRLNGVWAPIDTPDPGE